MQVVHEHAELLHEALDATNLPPASFDGDRAIMPAASSAHLLSALYRLTENASLSGGPSGNIHLVQIKH